MFKLTLTARRAVLALCLPLLLLTQQGIWLHAVTHLVSPPAAHVPADDGHGGKSSSCGLCLVFTSLNSGATAPALIFPAEPDIPSPVDRFTPCLLAQGSAARYFSRAPPPLA